MPFKPLQFSALGAVERSADGSYLARVRQKSRSKMSSINGPRRALRPDAEADLAAMRLAAEGKASREEWLAAMAAEAERLKDERASQLAARRLEAKQEVEETLRRSAGAVPAALGQNLVESSRI